MKVEERALKIRQDVFKMAMKANGGHIAPSYSCADILAVLFFEGILRYDPTRPAWRERDYFIMSKGHGVLALYAALSMAGYFPEETLWGFGQPGSELGSLAKRGGVPGIEASTGSLGHGLSFATGIALALRKQGAKNRVFVLLGDGECEEGSIWEGLMAAAHHGLDNLVVIIDDNRLQAMDSVEAIMSIDNFAERLRAFGFDTEEIDGHDYDAIRGSLNVHVEGRPRAIVAHTIKGRGISFMEGVPIWHYRVPKGEEIDIALKELGMTREDLGIYEDSLYRNII